MDHEMQKILSGLVRIGTVTDVDNARRMARVKFQDHDMTSGWLCVLKINRSSQVTPGRNGLNLRMEAPAMPPLQATSTI